jgi:glycosyltransferase involved in cell wall biosynthesis
MIFTNILTKHKIKFVICVSKSGYQEYKQFFDPLNIAIIPNGVDTAFFKCDNLEKYRKGVPQFIFVGNLYDHKNVAEIIMAIKELIKYYPKISLVIVGTGSSYNRLKKLVNDLNLQKHVRFTGQVTKDLPSYYSSSDVYVSASKSESSPLPPIEGMTCGLPSLLSSINPHIELIKNSGAGMIYEIGNVKDLSVKMIEIYEKRISFINHAFNYSRLNDWDYLVKNYISIYNKLLIK